ncbi:MAG: succinylglutamate desuccinylase/aspartoacylase family protein [Patescibacteria group bacterium]|nr:succinylglutamate desuccinylase/aspartoacylase family protein [Patescibacteria group bacterium]
MNNKNNEILFIGATHGHEPIGVNVLKRLERIRSGFDWIIGSPRALEAGTREFEGDLNRSAPGDPTSANYASRRAAEIIELSKKYRFTIDLHGSIKPVGVIIIITDPKVENLKLATLFGISRIVIWPAFSQEIQGPMSEFFSCGFSLESGPKELPKIEAMLENILIDFLDNYRQRENRDWKSELEKREIYQVYDSIKQDPGAALYEFTEATINNETFYPLLVGSYIKDKGIYCYKMKRVDAESLLQHTRSFS